MTMTKTWYRNFEKKVFSITKNGFKKDLLALPHTVITQVFSFSLKLICSKFLKKLFEKFTCANQFQIELDIDDYLIQVCYGCLNKLQLNGHLMMTTLMYF